MKQNPTADRPVTYEIRVQGQIDARWSAWFSGITLTPEGEITTLTGAIADQAALRGILTKLWDLNMTLISVNRIDVNPK